ncbi:hypothetical protein BKA83DRAFT_4056318, partial [Pisolithus microcarpus]
ICTSILGTEWSPVLSVSAVCITLQSMLAFCARVERSLPRSRNRCSSTPMLWSHRAKRTRKW